MNVGANAALATASVKTTVTSRSAFTANKLAGVMARSAEAPAIASALVAISIKPENVVVEPSAARFDGVRILSVATFANASPSVAVSNTPRCVVVASGRSSIICWILNVSRIVLLAESRVTMSALFALVIPRKSNSLAFCES